MGIPDFALLTRSGRPRPWAVGLVTSVVISLTAAVSIGVVYGAVRSALLDDLRNYLRRTAEMAASQIDGDRHRLIVDSSQTGSPEYRALVAPLAALLRVNPDIRFAYSGVARGDSMFFVLDADRSEPAWVMQPDPPTAGELEVTRTFETVVERQPSATAWGVGIRAYAPITGRAGPTGAFVGITMDADRYQSWLRRVYQVSILGLGAALLLAVLAGMVAARAARASMQAAAEMADARELAAAAAEDRRELEKQLHSRQKMEALGTLAGGVAHDFNNLLTVILGHSEMIEADAADGSSMGMSAATIRTAAVRARDVIRRILMFARPEAETRTPTSLGPVIDETVDLFRTTLPSSIEIVWRRPATPIAAVVNASQLTQVVMNLGVNASHAFLDERGRIEVGLDQVLLTAAAAARIGLGAGPYARITVRDNGVGITDEVRNRIFEPFFTTKPVGKGSGLGLAVAEGVVRGHGGAIEVESSLGAGTTFTIYLPQGDGIPGAPTAARAPAPTTHSGRGHRILLLDDDPLVLETTGKLLRRASYEVASYGDPETALAALVADPTGFQALITDRTMPKLSGPEVARRARAVNPGLPVVLLTGTLHPGDGSIPDITVAVSKPVDGPTLLGAIDRAISGGAHGTAPAEQEAGRV